jgi:hypothetical protein
VKSLGSFVKCVHHGFVILTDAATMRAALADLGLQGCNPSKVAGSRVKVLDVEPLNSLDH